MCFILTGHTDGQMPEASGQKSVSFDRQPGPWGYRVDALETGGTRVHPLGCLYNLDGIPVGPCWDTLECQLGLVFAGENKTTPIDCEVEWSVPDSISGQDQSLSSTIPPRNGKLTGKVVEALGAARGAELEDELTVSVNIEWCADFPASDACDIRSVVDEPVEYQWAARSPLDRAGTAAKAKVDLSCR
jgi:hypothetical protein